MMLRVKKAENEVGRLDQQSQEPSVPPTPSNPSDTPNITADRSKVTGSVSDPSRGTLAKNPDKTDLDEGLEPSETNVVEPCPSPSESKQSGSDAPSLVFEDYSPSMDASLNGEAYKRVLTTDDIPKQDEILTVDYEVDVVERPKPRLLKAVINCVPQVLPEHVRKHFKKGETSRKRKLSKSSDPSAPNKRSGQSNDLDDADSVATIANTMVEKSTELDASDKLYEVNLKRKLSKSSDPSAPNKRSGQSTDLDDADSVATIANTMVEKSTELDTSDKLYEVNMERKLSKSTDSSAPKKRSGQSNDLDEPDSVAAIVNTMVDKSTELDRSDKLYEVKLILLQVTRESCGVNLKRFRQFSNIFLKNWRFSKQFPGSNARGQKVIHNMLEKIVKELYGNHLIVIRGPEDNLDVIKMLTEEVKRDNSRIISRTPPTLTVLVTEDLFDKYYIDGSKKFLSSERGPKRSQGKSVSLGSASEQWFRLKKELGMDSHGDVASILIHCYKAWTSVACSKCRRHMEVGMEQKTGRALMNSERSVCIVSCECGTSTSGGFMIECDSCHKWQHGVCVDITKDNIPVHYACRRCCNIRGSVVLSPLHNERGGNMSDNSVVSIDNTELCSTDGSGPEVIELD